MSSDETRPDFQDACDSFYFFFFRWTEAEMDWVNGLTIFNIYRFILNVEQNMMNEDSATMEIDKKRKREKNIDFV